MIAQPAQVVTTSEAGLLLPVNTGAYASSAEALDGYFSYPLVLEPVTYPNRVVLVVTYDASVLSKDRIEALTCVIEHALNQLLAEGTSGASEAVLESVFVTGPRDLS